MAACEPCLLKTFGAKGAVSVPLRPAKVGAGTVPKHPPKLFTIKPGGIRQGRTGATRRSMTVSRLSGSSSAAINPPQGEPDRQSALSAALNWAPQLSSQQEAACASIAAFISFLVWAFSRPATIQPLYALGIACVFLGTFWLARCAFLEDQYQAKGRLVTDLGDFDSRFPLLEGLRVHAKSCLAQAFLPMEPQRSVQPETEQRNISSSSSSNSSSSASAKLLALHCYHGFGANLYSWAPCQKLMADTLQGLVTSHDMPGFGLTERPKDVSNYILAFNAKLGQLVQDYELQSLGLQQPPPSTSHAGGKGSLPQVEKEQRHGATRAGREQSMDGESLAAAGVTGGKEVPLNSAPSSAYSDSAPPPQPPYSSPTGSNASTTSSSYDSNVSWGQHQQQQENAEGAIPPSGSSSNGSSSDDRTGGDGNGAGYDMVTQSQGQPTAAVAVVRVLCGHSLGGICAALQALSSVQGQGEQDRHRGAATQGEAKGVTTESGEGWGVAGKEGWGPRKTAGLILVAPAILAGGDTNGEGDDGPQLEPLTDPLPLHTVRLGSHQGSHHGNGAGHGQRQAGVSRLQTKQGGEHQPQQQNRQQEVTPDLGHEGEAAFGSNVQRYVNSSSSSSGSSHSTSSGVQAAPAASKPPATPGASIRAALLNGVVSMARGALLLGVLLTLQACRPLVVGLLRALVRSPKFWVRGLSQAYYDPSRLSQELVDRYRLPSLVKGWEAGMFMFLLARLANISDVGEWARSGAVTTIRCVKHAYQSAMEVSSQSGRSSKSSNPGEQGAKAGTAAEEDELELKEEQALTARLTAAAAAGILPPVLIIHGDADRLVPLANSFRLAKMLPGAELAVVGQCGHNPQEEWPHTFTSLIADFVDRRVTRISPEGLAT
ncbi:Alpha/Beta hydrolase protein [Dunaliella salina]|uniref:Alpha/Beta hydrolase protein n=1 Tax=Dunaliella salina TaxID=3046 RepID=A0ABQ7H357_DUNSA|nr:Alpha/Beta hydrolase protein [Dunaliella salina]|eukprot:KAF5841299.1 Alpha/Beta hydrolase protein [Dunaliella salina]